MKICRETPNFVKIGQKSRAPDMKKEVRFTFAGDVNSPRKHFYATLNICILSRVTCI
jgi:hypothetical protein